jgi:prepilin-type N-terminal cleavage/methylation domain-containing protein
MKKKCGEKGFSYIEVIISMVILTIGLLGALSALTWGIVYVQEAEKKTKAKQLGNSIIESIFAVRDMRTKDGVAFDGWQSVQVKSGSNVGIFAQGWYPVRENQGADAIYGTADDSCTTGTCNTNPVVQGYDRLIEISDITENNAVFKRRISVTIRYYVGTLARQEKVATIVACLPREDLPCDES